MLVVHGKQLAEVSTADVDALLAPFQRVVVDVGTGDGRLAYALARGDPETFVVGIDATAENLRQTSHRALRKPSRGGLPNVAFVVAGAEAPPAELQRRAETVHVILPWGKLMIGLLRAEHDVLSGLARLARPDGRLHVILNGEIWGDPVPVEARHLPEPTVVYVREVLTPAYEREGIVLEDARLMTPGATAAIPSTWAKRLAHGRDEPRFIEFDGSFRESARGISPPIAQGGGCEAS